MVMCRSCSQGPQMAGPQKQERWGQRKGRLNEMRAFLRTLRCEFWMLKKKKRMEYLAICVITLTMQEFSAYKKHDTAQAGHGVGGVGGGTLSNSYVMGIFLPVAGTFLSRPDVPTRLTQPAMDAGGFLNSWRSEVSELAWLPPGSAALCTAIYISFLSTFYCRKDSDILKITKHRKTPPEFTVQLQQSSDTYPAHYRV